MSYSTTSVQLFWSSLNCNFSPFFLSQWKDIGFDKLTLFHKRFFPQTLLSWALKCCQSMWECSVRMLPIAYALRKACRYFRVRHLKSGFCHLFRLWANNFRTEGENTEMIAWFLCKASYYSVLVLLFQIIVCKMRLTILTGLLSRTQIS